MRPICSIIDRVNGTGPFTRQFIYWVSGTGLSICVRLIYTGLIYSIFCRVNGSNEAYLLDNLSIWEWGFGVSVVMAGSWSERDVIWLKPSHHISLHRFSVLINIIIWYMIPTILFPDNLLSKWACPIYSIFRRVNRPAQILISHRADGPHSRLLYFLSSRWAVPSKRFRTYLVLLASNFSMWVW